MASLSMASRAVRRLEVGSACQKQTVGHLGHRSCLGILSSGGTYGGCTLAIGSPRMPQSSGSYGLRAWLVSPCCYAQRDGSEEKPLGDSGGSTNNSSELEDRFDESMLSKMLLSSLIFKYMIVKLNRKRAAGTLLTFATVLICVLAAASVYALLDPTGCAHALQALLPAVAREVPWVQRLGALGSYASFSSAIWRVNTDYQVATYTLRGLTRQFLRLPPADRKLVEKRLGHDAVVLKESTVESDLRIVRNVQAHLFSHICQFKAAYTAACLTVFGLVMVSRNRAAFGGSLVAWLWLFQSGV